MKPAFARLSSRWVWATRLIDMPLYLEPGRYVALPLEETHETAFHAGEKKGTGVVLGYKKKGTESF